jgi:hypothetical protein
MTMCQVNWPSVQELLLALSICKAGMLSTSLQWSVTVCSDYEVIIGLMAWRVFGIGIVQLVTRSSVRCYVTTD